MHPRMLEFVVEIESGEKTIAISVSHLAEKGYCYEIHQTEGTLLQLTKEQVSKIASHTIGGLEHFELVGASHWEWTFTRMPNLTQLAMCLEQCVASTQI